MASVSRLAVISSENIRDIDAETLTMAEDVSSTPVTQPKSRAFYLSFVAIMVTIFLSALDLSAVSTALPTIAEALNDTKGDFTWVGSAYALSSTVFIPLSGSLAEAFGRRPIMLLAITFFTIGSALTGAAQNMSMIIAARAIQGVGGGAIINVSEILVADLVPLSERGLYQGLIGLIWSLASCIGPPIGGALANNGHKAWRWLFFLNLPICVVAFLLVVFFLRVRTPPGSTRKKLAQVDWIGNAIVVLGSGLSIIGLTWGGIRYPWKSAEVLAPLVIGLVLLVVFGVFEAKVPSRPTIPSDIVSNRTTLSGLLATAIHGIVSIAVIYYLPVFFQACFGASPVRSSVDYLPAALVTAPFALVAGVLVNALNKYRAVNFTGWIFLLVGFGLFSTLREDSSVGKWVGFQIIVAIGIGMLFSAPIFPLLAPLPPNRAAAALALFSFTRSFFQTWGITISSTILQNMLKKKLPAEFIGRFPEGFEIAYAAIPIIKQLDESLKKQVQAAFAQSIAVIWQAMIGIAGLGLLFSLLMAEVPMANTVDEKYALEEKEVRLQVDVEEQPGLRS
ncbi:MFS domain-containing protein [Favolaschia claudopus]|uniref:MFS domain-containing protein n=1 Tax=Favolaschia claudopus TaxID=2862362 RepID=A0AAW0ECS5_9AGAR